MIVIGLNELFIFLICWMFWIIFDIVPSFEICFYILFIRIERKITNLCTIISFYSSYIKSNCIKINHGLLLGLEVVTIELQFYHRTNPFTTHQSNDRKLKPISTDVLSVMSSTTNDVMSRLLIHVFKFSSITHIFRTY